MDQLAVINCGYRCVLYGILPKYQSMAHLFHENTASQLLKTFPIFEIKKYENAAAVRKDNIINNFFASESDCVKILNSILTRKLPLFLRISI